MELYLIRHPISEGNVLQIAQDNFKGKIHAKGYAQIEELCKRLKQEEIDQIYSSDSERCRELSQSIADSFGLEPEYNSLFREINNGDWSGMDKAEMSKYRFEKDEGCSPPNGESLNQLSCRVKIAKNYIMDGNKKRIALISHGWFLKAFLGRYIGLGIKNSIQHLKFSNCAMSKISFQGDETVIEYLNNRDYLEIR